MGSGHAIGLVTLVLAGVVGAAIAGGQPVDRPTARATPPPTVLNVDFVPRPSPWAVPRPTVDPATFEGASVLAAGGLAIPPRWLASRTSSTRMTARLDELGWRTDPYAK
jgi:hypothetical protein